MSYRLYVELVSPTPQAANVKQMKALQTMIDEVLARDAAMLDKDMLMKPDGK